MSDQAIAIVAAVNAASSQAGKADAGWNRRFVDALEAMGLSLVARQPDNDPGEIMAPIPWHEGWQYPYPSTVCR